MTSGIIHVYRARALKYMTKKGDWVTSMEIASVVTGIPVHEIEGMSSVRREIQRTYGYRAIMALKEEGLLEEGIVNGHTKKWRLKTAADTQP